ncbi:unnamed protein product [Parnassius mnemosyne]|uniref:Major facilitator superfamily (MFS) profile domain-containing protein n=1 Tax=Parnassius mnemosyne TaxID=213953 RepID=A0AAV1L8W7_9NEOP
MKHHVQARPGHTRVQWTLAILANSTLIFYGMESGWMSPMTKVLQSEESPVGAPISDNTISLIASILCFTATITTSIYSYIADNFGRKPAVIAVAVPQALAWICKLSTSTTAGLMAARALNGFAAGGCFTIVPMYVKEISQDDIRGLLGSLLIMGQNLGIFIMYAMGAYLDYYLVLWIVFSLPLVTAILMLKAPESPAYLVKKGQFELAAKTIAFLRGLEIDDKIVQKEVDIMRDQEFFFQSLPKISFLSILRNRNWRHSVILNVSIIAFQASNGVFAIISYGASTLAASEVKHSISPELQTLSFPVVMIIGSFVSMGCVERFGRKPLLAGTLLMSACSMGTLASAMLLQSYGFTPPIWLPVLAMIASVFAFAAGVAPLPFIIMAEMFNFQIRAKMMGLAVTFAWFMTFVQLFLYAPISSSLGPHSTFFCFAGVNLLGFFVTLIFLPETKGKSDEEIEAELRKK